MEFNSTIKANEHEKEEQIALELSISYIKSN